MRGRERRLSGELCRAAVRLAKHAPAPGAFFTRTICVGVAAPLVPVYPLYPTLCPSRQPSRLLVLMLFSY